MTICTLMFNLTELLQLMETAMHWKSTNTDMLQVMFTKHSLLKRSKTIIENAETVRLTIPKKDFANWATELAKADLRVVNVAILTVTI